MATEFSSTIIFIYTKNDEPQTIIKTIHSPDMIPAEGECVIVNSQRYNVRRCMIDYDENKHYTFLEDLPEKEDD